MNKAASEASAEGDKAFDLSALQELQEKLDLQQRDRKRAIAKINRVSSPSVCISVCCDYRTLIGQ